jgi:hypothetical protein
MSESTSAPAAPASTDSGPAIGPAPASQPAISVSEAARLLSSQRRKEGDAPAAAPTDRRPSPNEMTAKAADAAPASDQAKPGETRQNPTKAADTGLSAMERALGVPGGTPAPESTTADAGIIEIEGQRLRTLDEVREFARRKSADYTTKTQEIAQQRQALQAQQEALATVLPYIQPELARLAQLVQGTNKPDPQLLETDPSRYLRERAAWEQALDEQNRLGGLTQLQQQAQQRAMEQQVNTANEQLAKEFPTFWADPVERGKAQQEIVAWATTKGGFSRDELRGLTNPNHLKTMMKAMQYDKWVDGAKTTAPAQLRAPVRGAPPPPAPTERVSVAEQTFDTRPNIRNAAQLLAARRANGSAPR